MRRYDPCNGDGNVFGHVACGWAFDAGMREAERDDERSRPNREASRRYEQESRHLSEMHAAVAAERERCAELHGLLLQVAPWIGGVPFHPDTVADVAAAKRRIYEIIEGAPAPREG